MSKNLTTSAYTQIQKILQEARSNAYKAVNFAMVQAYWNIGKTIVEEEQKGENRAKYGKQLLINLSIQLTKDFGKGFDKTNLWKMRSFYSTFPKIDALRRELSWTHYRKNRCNLCNLERNAFQIGINIFTR